MWWPSEPPRRRIERRVDSAPFRYAWAAIACPASCTATARVSSGRTRCSPPCRTRRSSSRRRGRPSRIHPARSDARSSAPSSRPARSSPASSPSSCARARRGVAAGRGRPRARRGSGRARRCPRDRASSACGTTHGGPSARAASGPGRAARSGRSSRR